MQRPPASRRRTGWSKVIIFLIAGSTWVAAAPLVYIRSTVDAKYAAARAERNPPRDETYVFYQGKFFPGQIVDRTLEKMRFIEIARFLAPQLKRQHYVPAGSLSQADLVIVVHWGTTVGKNRSDALVSYSLHAETQLNLVGADADYQAARAAIETTGPTTAGMDALREAETRMNDLTASQAQQTDFTRLTNDVATSSNASLLGLTEVLREENRAAFVSSTMHTIESILDEDRYFLIVIAYDRRAITEQKEARRVWSARINVRAAGVNFREAVGYLSAAGGSLFGQQSERMTILRPGKDALIPNADVTIGELKVIDEPPPGR